MVRNRNRLAKEEGAKLEEVINTLQKTAEKMDALIKILSA